MLPVIVFALGLLTITAVATYLLGHRTGSFVIICLLGAAIGQTGSTVIAVNQIAQIACDGTHPCSAVADGGTSTDLPDAELRSLQRYRELNSRYGWLLWGLSVATVFLITPRRANRQADSRS